MYVFHKIKHAYNIIMKFIYKLLIIMNIQYIIILIAVDTSYLLYIDLILQIYRNRRAEIERWFHRS